MWPELRRGMVVSAALDPTRGREQAGRRPALIIASDLYLEHADTLAIILPATTIERGWPNHVRLRGPTYTPTRPTFAMTEQPRTVTRERLHDVVGVVDSETMDEVDGWLRDFLSLPSG
ncbi:type II toxin-antitoxin system PemK/MazF family toxin [Gordonia sp. NPDC003424]